MEAKPRLLILRKVWDPGCLNNSDKDKEGHSRAEFCPHSFMKTHPIKLLLRLHGHVPVHPR
eukprot:1143988-Lingulodinium_polyedra.AAC.1